MKFEELRVKADRLEPLVGRASYYNIESCKREGTSGIMANGKPLNDDALTCASWFYPLGARLLVVSPFTGRYVVVEVTDRGPSKHLVESSDRVIDLSEAAFAALEHLSAGLLLVHVFKLNKEVK